MKDIRPMPRKPISSDRPRPPEDELYEVSQVAKQQTRPWRGSQVPIANVHVEEKSPRPLFAKTPVVKTARKIPMRLGSRERTMIFGFITIIAIVALLGAAIFLPHANIIMALRTAPLLVDEELKIMAQETQAAKTVPGAGFLREILVEGAIPVVSTEMVGSKSASTVELINKTTDEQKIKEKSRLVTKDGVLFYMQQPAFIPANGRVSVAVEAAESGETGNIEPQRLNFAALDPAAQNVVYAEATKAFTNGTGEEVHVIQEEDIERAKAAAQDAAISSVKDDVQKQLPRGWALLEESWAAELKNLTIDGEVGKRAPQMAYKGQASVHVLGYETVKLEEQLRATLTSRLDKEYALFPGPISFSKIVKSVDWEKGEGIMLVRVTHTTIPDFSLETLRAKIAGRSKEEAVEYLQGLPGVQSVDLTLAPFWVQSIPRIEKRINLELVPERQP